MMALRSLLWALFAALLGAAAWAQSSMTPDQAYVRAVTFMQGELNRIESDNRIRQAKAAGERIAMKAQLDAALQELAGLRADAAKNKAAATALAAFAENDAAGGLDALEAEAKTKSAAALKDWKRIGALAFASDTDRAIRAYREALKLAPDDVEALSRFGWLATRVGDLGGANEAAGRLMQNADPAAKARGALNAARIAMMQDNPQRAEALYKLAFEPARAAKSVALEAEAVLGLAATAQAQGQWARAEGFGKDALGAYQKLKDEAGIAEALLALAASARLRGIWVQSEVYLKEALAIYERRQDQVGLAATQLGLGETAMNRQSPIEAAGRFREAMKAFQALGDRAGQADSAKGIADAAAARGAMPEACLSWRMAQGLYAQTGALNGAPAKAVVENLRTRCR
jgi:tetratricopeptide (TPR) repeat protein